MRPNDTILSSKVERMMALQMLDTFPGFLLKTGRVPRNKAICKCLEISLSNNYIYSNSYLHVTDNRGNFLPCAIELHT